MIKEDDQKHSLGRVADVPAFNPLVPSLMKAEPDFNPEAVTDEQRRIWGFDAAAPRCGCASILSLTYHRDAPPTKPTRKRPPGKRPATRYVYDNTIVIICEKHDAAWQIAEVCAQPELQLREEGELTPCCHSTMGASRADHWAGSLLQSTAIGVCKVCMDTSARTNPRTGCSEWLNGCAPNDPRDAGICDHCFGSNGVKAPKGAPVYICIPCESYLRNQGMSVGGIVQVTACKVHPKELTGQVHFPATCTCRYNPKPHHHHCACWFDLRACCNCTEPAYEPAGPITPMGKWGVCNG